MSPHERAEKERQFLQQEARDASARRISQSNSTGSSDSALHDLNFRLKKIKAMTQEKLIDSADQRLAKAAPPVLPTAPGGFRLDEWTCIYQAPTAAPFELKPKGSTFRGMKDLEAAKSYAQDVVDFFQEHGLEKNAFVVKGPTTTASFAFEVVTETSVYTVVHTARAQPKTSSSRGLRP